MNKTINKKHLFAASLGNTLEWYDFAIYGYFAIVIGDLFFPSDNQTLSLIAAFAAFASGYLARPIGALIFGYIGDNVSRKKALVGSIALMAVSTLAIALLPTYEHIGIFAPILLILLRILAGISVGGEYISSAIYVLESSNKNKYFNISIIIVGATAGFLLGSIVSTLINVVIPQEYAYLSWRIAFLLGIIIALVGMFVRKTMPDVIAQDSVAIKNPITSILKFHKIQLLQNIGINFLSATLFYTLFVYAVSWLVNSANISKTTALDVNLYGLISLIFAVLFGGYLANNFSHKKIAATSAFIITISIYPLFWLINHQEFLYEVVGEVSLAIMIGIISPALLSLQLENFKSNIRASGGAFAYNLSWGVFGGTAPLVASFLLLETGNQLSFTYYIMASGVVTFFTILSIKRPPH